MLAGRRGVLAGGAAFLFQLVKSGGQFFVIVAAEFIDNNSSEPNGVIVTFDAYIIAFVEMEAVQEFFWNGYLFIAGNAA